MRNDWKNDDPFPHWIIRGLWNPDLLADAAVEIAGTPPTNPMWQSFDNPDERKLAMSSRGGWGPRTTEALDLMQSPLFTRFLSMMTGIDNLKGKIEGGGVHRIQPGGLLQTHVDFNRSSEDDSYRRLNCLVYLNDNWTEDDGGHLELRHNADDTDPAVRVLPEFNTMVVFETSERSWHGHPVPLPGPRERLSLAAYYYTDEPPPNVSTPHTTIFAPRS